MSNACHRAGIFTDARMPCRFQRRRELEGFVGTRQRYQALAHATSGAVDSQANRHGEVLPCEFRAGRQNVSEKGTVPFFSQGTEKLGQSPPFVSRLLAVKLDRLDDLIELVG